MENTVSWYVSPVQLWFHSRVTISSNKKWSFDTCSNGNHLLCYIHIQLHTRKDGKKAIFSDIALGGLSGELSWMLFFFLAKTKTTTREPFFSPLKLALLFLPSSAFFLFYFYEVRFTHDWTLLPIAKIEAALARVVQVSI